MLLGMFPMNCFEFLRILEKNRKKGKLENLGKHKPLHRSEGHPRRCVALGSSEGCLTAARPKDQKGPPWLCYGVALLHRGVGTAHRGKIFGFYFQAPRIRALIVWGP